MSELTRKTSQDYRGFLLRLLPWGKAWPREIPTPLSRLLHGHADELARVDGRIIDLLDEADPRTTTDLLAAWERNAGLDGAGLTLAQRRDRLHARLIARGGQSRAYFIDLALTAFGLAITITEFAVADMFRPEVSMPDINAIVDEGHAFWWQVNGSGLDAGLMALFEDYKPAHTRIYWAS